MQAGSHGILDLNAVICQLIHRAMDGIDVAAQIIQQIQRVNTLVDHAAAASSFQLAAPGLFVIVSLAAEPGYKAAAADDLAIFAAIDDLFQFNGGAVQTILQADADLDLRVRSLKFHKLLGLCGVQTHRLFAEDIYTVGSKILRHGHMQVMRQAEMYHIGMLLFQKLLIVRIERHGLCCSRQLFLHSGIVIAHGTQFDLRICHNDGQMNLKDGAAANDRSSFHGNATPCKPGTGIAFFRDTDYSRTGNLPSASISLFSSAAYSSGSQGLETSRPVHADSWLLFARLTPLMPSSPGASSGLPVRM